MKKSILLVLTLVSLLLHAQDKIAVQKVNIKSTLFEEENNEIPKVIPLKKEYTAVANKINQFILEEFMIEGFQLKKEEDFRYSDCKFKYQLSPTHLYLKTEGEYLGPYPSPFERELIFNLKNGAVENNENIPFQAFFTLNGYLDFMEKHWLTEAKKEFVTAIKDCEGSEPYCSYYDIEKYEVTNNQLTISLTNDCYPHVAKACTPYLTKSFSKEVMKKFLSEWGYKILFNANYTSKKAIDKFIINQKERNNAENNIFLFGKINKLYPISMALTLSNKDNSVSGYYYYDKKKIKIKIKLRGTYSTNAISLNEFTNNQNTGNFSLKFSENYNEDGIFIDDNDNQSKYLTGNWSNNKNHFKIIFNAIVFNKYPKIMLAKQTKN
ncbi:hypothetical protein [Flavobacterium faecale]|uniref:hypothetical protein n=1 Tax=Flavobacterium faecale TaxID=1355330 RepID=UPI003AAE1FDB